MTGPAITVRPRAPTDIPALCDLLVKQRPATGYPEIWPLPMPIPDFLQRDNDEHAFVAELNGEIVGHVGVAYVRPSEEKVRSGSTAHTAGLGEAWATAYGAEIDRLRCIGTLYTDAAIARAGIGSALLEAATRDVVERGLLPVLDCVKAKTHVVAFYERRGWAVIDERPAPWSPHKRIDVVLMVLPQYKVSLLHTTGLEKKSGS